MSVFIDISSCITNSTFTVTYANVTPGPVSITPYTFISWTDIGPGGEGLVVTTAPAPTVLVDPKTLTVSATGLTPGNKVYDGTTNASLTIGSPTLVGVISPDVVTLNTSGASASFVDKNAGTGKTVNITGLVLGGPAASNYLLGAADPNSEYQHAPTYHHSGNGFQSI